MRQPDISIALTLGNNFSCRSLGGLPVPQLHAMLDHLFLTRQAVAAILLVRFFEALESRVRHPPLQMLRSFRIRILRLFIGRTSAVRSQSDGVMAHANMTAMGAYRILILPVTRESAVQKPSRVLWIGVKIFEDCRSLGRNGLVHQIAADAVE